MQLQKFLPLLCDWNLEQRSCQIPLAARLRRDYREAWGEAGKLVREVLQLFRKEQLGLM